MNRRPPPCKRKLPPRWERPSSFSTDTPSVFPNRSSSASSTAVHAAGLRSTSARCRATQPDSVSRSRTSLSHSLTCSATNAHALCRLSAVTYSRGQPSPQPIMPSDVRASTHRVCETERSADACLKATLNGIVSTDARIDSRFTAQQLSVQASRSKLKSFVYASATTLNCPSRWPCFTQNCL